MDDRDDTDSGGVPSVALLRLTGLRVALHPLDYLLLAAPVAGVAQALHWSGVLLFFASGLAIVPLARLIGTTTEELAGRVGAAAGGLLNATFGNATELIIAVVALEAGRADVVKASLVGSILGNVLTVLGLSFVLGGARRERQYFDRTAASAAGAQLAVAGFGLLIPAVLAGTQSVRPAAIEGLSVATAVVLLLGYGTGLLFSLRTHAHLYTEEQEEEMHGPSWGVRNAVVVLLLATVGVAVLSDWLVAIDLSLSIALGSAAQIALFVAPVLVVLGLALGHPMDLLFDTFEVAAVVIAVALVNLLIHDGESTWLEGIQLLAVYAILACAFFVHR